MAHLILNNDVSRCSDLTERADDLLSGSPLQLRILLGQGIHLPSISPNLHYTKNHALRDLVRPGRQFLALWSRDRRCNLLRNTAYWRALGGHSGWPHIDSPQVVAGSVCTHRCARPLHLHSSVAQCLEAEDSHPPTRPCSRSIFSSFDVSARSR
jgi:hypothetical protein